METIRKLEKGCGNIHNYNNDGSTEGCAENSLCGSCELEIQTLKDVLKLIDEKIKVRKGSLKWSVSDYEEVFSINDLNSIIHKIMGVNHDLGEQK